MAIPSSQYDVSEASKLMAYKYLESPENTADLSYVIKWVAVIFWRTVYFFTGHIVSDYRLADSVQKYLDRALLGLQDELIITIAEDLYKRVGDYNNLQVNLNTFKNTFNLRQTQANDLLNARNEVLQLNADKSTLEGQINTLNGRITTLETSAENAQNEIEVLTTGKEEMIIEFNGMREKLESFKNAFERSELEICLDKALTCFKELDKSYKNMQIDLSKSKEQNFKEASDEKDLKSERVIKYIEIFSNAIEFLKLDRSLKNPSETASNSENRAVLLKLADQLIKDIDTQISLLSNIIKKINNFFSRKNTSKNDFSSEVDDTKKLLNILKSVVENKYNYWKSHAKAEVAKQSILEIKFDTVKLDSFLNLSEESKKYWQMRKEL